MPIYEYTCRSCRSPFERLVRTAAAGDAPAACPKCGSTQTLRKLSLFAVGAEAGGVASQPAGTSAAGRCGCGNMPGTCGMD